MERGRESALAALGSNQRPTLVRLKSGRLFIATDCQHISAMPPDGLKLRGVVVGLSDDEGETWRLKQLPQATPHERFRNKTDVWQPHDGLEHRYPTLGYAVAAQSPNGNIHLMSSMNHPSLHFEMNEAWILSSDTNETSEAAAAPGPAVTHEERYPSGFPKMTWSSRVDADGRYVLDGAETWYYPSGATQYTVTYAKGRKTGKESYFDESGKLKWSWDRGSDGRSTWTQFWPNGQKRVQSHWAGVKADGLATQWDREGRVVTEAHFKGGALQE